MGLWDDISDILQKPQALYEGATAGLSNQFARYYGKKKDEDELSKMFKDLEEAGVDVAEYEHLRPLAQTFLGGIKDAWNRDDVTPSRMAQQAKPVEQWDDKLDIIETVLGVGSNVLQDPSLVLGQGVAGKVASKGGKIGELGKGAATFGKMEKGSGMAQRAGQTARYGVQGMIGSAGDPMGALTTMGGVALGERVASPLIRAAGSRLARKGGSEAVEQLGLPGPTFGPAEPAFNPTSPAFKTGAGAARADLPVEMRALGPGGTKALPRGSGHSFNPGSQAPIEAGPVGSTGAAGNMDRIMEMVMGQPKALPSAFGTSGGYPMGGARPPIKGGRLSERDLLMILREEARRLRG